MARVSFRNLRRRVFATIAIASLVLCLATVGLWVRSYHAGDAIGYPDAHYHYSQSGKLGLVILDVGSRVWISGTRPAVQSPEPLRRWQWPVFIDVAPNPPRFAWAGFSSRRGRNWTEYAIPTWSLALLFAILPAWWGMAIVRSRYRVQPGCCVTCGYDLRASPDRCPECGAAC